MGEGRGEIRNTNGERRERLGVRKGRVKDMSGERKIGSKDGKSGICERGAGKQLGEEMMTGRRQKWGILVGK